MCIICVSPKGQPQPSETIIKNMFKRNPHGAGYMVARDGKVYIHKGFMYLRDYLRAIHDEHFTDDDAVVYHFRISTQAGVNPEMTHPFPLSSRKTDMRILDVSCDIGIAHNGIIHLTSDPNEHKYSDTALFITRYLTQLIHNKSDLLDPDIQLEIDWLAQSKFAFLDSAGLTTTIGTFHNFGGCLYSNFSFLPDTVKR